MLPLMVGISRYIITNQQILCIVIATDTHRKTILKNNYAAEPERISPAERNIMIILSVIEYYDGHEVSRTNYPNPVCIQNVCYNEILVSFINALDCLNTIRIDLNKYSIELFKKKF